MFVRERGLPAMKLRVSENTSNVVRSSGATSRFSGKPGVTLVPPTNPNDPRWPSIGFGIETPTSTRSKIERTCLLRTSGCWSADDTTAGNNAKSRGVRQNGTDCAAVTMHGPFSGSRSQTPLLVSYPSLRVFKMLASEWCIMVP